MSKKRRAYSSRSNAKPTWYRWIPWVGALLVVIFIIGGVWLASSPGTSQQTSGTRPQEIYMGVSGTSYNQGETNYSYPDPGGKGEGQQWLPSLGDENAPVVIVEFSDIFCGHCRNFHNDGLEGILKDYVAKGKVRYVDHYFGFASSVQNGALEAMFCAAEQGRYFNFKHTLFQAIEAGDFNIERAARIADVDMAAFAQCREAQRYAGAMQEMIQDGNAKVEGTPTFFVNGEKVVGNAPEQIRGLVEQALAEQ